MRQTAGGSIRMNGRGRGNGVAQRRSAKGTAIPKQLERECNRFAGPTYRNRTVCWPIQPANYSYVYDCDLLTVACAVGSAVSNARNDDNGGTIPETEFPYDPRNGFLVLSSRRDQSTFLIARPWCCCHYSSLPPQTNACSFFFRHTSNSTNHGDHSHHQQQGTCWNT